MHRPIYFSLTYVFTVKLAVKTNKSEVIDYTRMYVVYV